MWSRHWGCRGGGAAQGSKWSIWGVQGECPEKMFSLPPSAKEITIFASGGQNRKKPVDLHPQTFGGLLFMEKCEEFMYFVRACTTIPSNMLCASNK